MAYRLSFDEHKKAIVEKLKLELMDKRTETAQQRKLSREQRFATATEWLNADIFSAEQSDAELWQLMAVDKQQADEMLPRIWPIVSELRASLNTEQKAKLEKKLKHWQKKGSHRG